MDAELAATPSKKLQVWKSPPQGALSELELMSLDEATRAKPEARSSETSPFLPLNIAVVTVSDTRDEATDTSGALLAERLQAAGHRLATKSIVADEIEVIRAVLQTLIDDPGIDVVLTTGGTGFSERDVTPEAVRPLLRREMEGFAVVFHQVSFSTVGVSTLQSRALAGQAGDTFIFCIPGSTGACMDAWDHVLRHEFNSRYRPCSLVGQIPRYRDVCR